LKKIFLKFSKALYLKKIDTFLQKTEQWQKELIVESLQRQKQSRNFGSDFQVESSYGHIADLPSKK
jgi:hypothetical protein